MPSDNSLSQEPSIHHSDASSPYPCHKWEHPPKAEWSIDYGYCRNSLDLQPINYKQGSSDPRCPRDCPHKAPMNVVRRFSADFVNKGSRHAARISKAARERQDSLKNNMADTEQSINKLKTIPQPLNIDPRIQHNITGA